MRVPVSWLREYVRVDATADEIAHALSISTHEVNEVVHRGVSQAEGNLDRFRVGLVLEAAKHPNADRLQLCSVDVGEERPYQIVCGAWNFGAGAKVAVALPGATLPNGLTLERRELRGQVSEGMILAEDEVDLGTDHTGIMVLDAALEPGTPLAEVLPLVEQVLDVEPTGNRPDLLSVYGIAREVAALFDGELVPLDLSEPADPGVRSTVEIRIDDFDGCPRYIGRLFRDVAIGESPVWLKARLRAAGVRAISNVVDVTNYVMLALGSPLHVFDFDTLHGGCVIVRRAREGEELRTLDGTLRRLDPSDLMITDGEKSVALAAIMGGHESEVSEQTTEVLLEAANFEPIGILKTSERLGLRTEGSNRWEKGVDPHSAEPAAVLASRLIVDLAGAELTGGADVHSGLPERPVVRLRPERTDRIVGLQVAPEEQRAILSRLGFEVSEEWDVTVPTWRARDVTREIDVVEEVARTVLDRVPRTMPLRRSVAGHLSEDQRLRRLVEDVLVGAGFSEAYTWSLVATDQHPEAICLPMPMTSEQAILRTTLLSGLVDAARVNVDAGNAPIVLFELARVYLPSGEQLPDERWHVGGIVQGGFTAVKAAVETVYAALHLELRVRRAILGHLHPGKGAETDAGWLGELHPALLDGEWGVFELDLATLFGPIPERIDYLDVITYPAVRQDIAVTVAEEVEAGAIRDVIVETGGDELREARVFDVYRGEQVGAGRKSVAVHLSFQSSERTLSDDDAATIRERIVAALSDRFEAELRA